MAFLTGRASRRLAVAPLAACLLLAAPAEAQPSEPIEAQLKAVFLFNFAKYVNWRAPAPAGRGPAELRVCTTADDEFFAMVRSALEGEDIDGRRLVAVALDGLDAARTCQILYVGDASTADAKDWFDAVKGVDVLTVGDGTLADEPVISFVRDQNRLRFDVNRAAASKHDLSISAKLLRLARRVKQ